MNNKPTRGTISKAFIRSVSAPKTYDAERNTMEVVFSTGSKGLRQAWFGDYYEELSMEKKSVRLDRLNNGAPVLADHEANLESVIGVVEKAKISDGEGVATVRFSSDEKSQPLIQKIRDGIIKNVSVGYMVYRYEELGAPEGEPPTFRAVDWEPLEISFVAIPFDANAQSRSALDKSQCEVKFREDKMEELKEEVKKEESPAVEPVKEEEKKEEAPKEEPKKEEVKSEEPPKEEPKEEPKSEPSASDERGRITSIMKAVRTAGLDNDFALELIEQGKSLEQAQDEIHKRWAQKGNKTMIESKIEVTTDEKETLARGMTEALCHRVGTVKELSDLGREHRGLSLIRMAEKMLRQNGQKTDRMSAAEIAKMALSGSFWSRSGYHGTTDFPSVLADVANKTLRAAYEQAPQTFLPLVRKVTAPDFKNINRVQLGEAPSLEKVNEHGEFQYGTIGDAKEVYKILSYGKLIGLTRQALINDDTDSFGRIPQLMGRAAANLESDLVWGIITANAAMGDGIALFHASHGNLGSAGPISSTTLSEMRKLGRLQTGLDGATLLNIMYRFLIVPAALETVAQQAVAQVVPNQTTGVNVFSGMYQVISEPRLDASSETAWYASADPGQIDTIEMAYLEGQSGVRLESEMDFDTDGMKLKVAHDVGVKAIDHRGLFKNAGA